MGKDKIIEVCSECLQASCWHGEFLCSDSQNAGTVLKPVSELTKLGLENPDNWSDEKLKSVYGEAAPNGYSKTGSLDDEIQGMIKKINIKAADPMPAGFKQPEPVVIEISGNVSDDTKPVKSLDDVKKYFDLEATKLFYALVGSLPQGVIEPLVIKLLQHRVSLYHGVTE